MPEINQRGKLFRSWESLIGAYVSNTTLLPGGDALRQELETLLAQARALKVEQENLIGQRKAVTQRLRKAVDDGREVARKLQSFVLVNFNSRDEQLTQFGITPNRPAKARKSKEPEKPAPTTPQGDSNPASAKPAA